MFYFRIKDSLRTLFRIRQIRCSPPTGAKPPLGSTIVLNTLKMQLLVPIDNEQWQWLSHRGWRALDMRKNRRRYYRVPKAAVERFILASAEDRDKLYQRLVTYPYTHRFLE
ncbi:hypothetical protein [Undibacterium sp. RuRC25W]|uniref:hypothetical protein n=1 Tax=Undibacterium sp. RuRC25W TaxID=3413047 RepID=UPI003BF191CA